MKGLTDQYRISVKWMSSLVSFFVPNWLYNEFMKISYIINSSVPILHFIQFILYIGEYSCTGFILYWIYSVSNFNILPSFLVSYSICLDVLELYFTNVLYRKYSVPSLISTKFSLITIGSGPLSDKSIYTHFILHPVYFEYCLVYLYEIYPESNFDFMYCLSYWPNLIRQ